MLVFLFSLLFVQSDTLTQAYSDKWDGPMADESAFLSLMSSNDMIFVVLGVSLIIWFTLLGYLFITERRLARLEKQFENSK